MPTAATEVRHFLYLDDSLVKEFVAQLEEGELDEVQFESFNRQVATARGRVGLPLIGVEGSIDGGESESLAYSLRLSAPSRFQRLWRRLGELGALAVDPGDLAAVPAGGFAVIDSDIALTGLSRMSMGFRELERSATFFGQPSADAGSRQPWPQRAIRRLRGQLRARKQVNEWARFRRMTRALEGSNVAVIGVSLDAHRTKVLARLRRDCLNVAVPDIEGRARLMVKIARHVAKGEVVDAADMFPGARQLTTAFRKGMEASPAVGLLGQMTVTAPAAVVTPVAVYR